MQEEWRLRGWEMLRRGKVNCNELLRQQVRTYGTAGVGELVRFLVDRNKACPRFERMARPKDRPGFLF